MNAPADMAAKPADRPVFGTLCLLTSMLFVAGMDGCAKYLTQHYPVLEVTWGRYFFHFLVLLPVLLWRHGLGPLLRPAQLGLQLLRSVLLLISTILFFAGLMVMPIAEVLALALVAPLVVTALAPFLLNERVGIRRYSAVAIGFMGALLIIRPGSAMFQWAGLLGLSAGTIYAFYVVATRR
ncbi:MAG: EamA/RhaT family transporter, partial [Alphaproteobacteria bacterium]|nr:EamA/RhaT family transporter [Alphaproteobacteria bacterium]